MVLRCHHIPFVGNEYNKSTRHHTIYICKSDGFIDRINIHARFEIFEIILINRLKVY